MRGSLDMWYVTIEVVCPWCTYYPSDVVQLPQQQPILQLISGFKLYW